MEGNRIKTYGFHFWASVDPFGQIMIKVNVEVLLLEVSMFNHETPQKNFSFYQKMLQVLTNYTLSDVFLYTHVLHYLFINILTY